MVRFDEEQPSSTPLTKSFFRERKRDRQKTSTTTILVIFHRWKINPVNYKIITICTIELFCHEKSCKFSGGCRCSLLRAHITCSEIMPREEENLQSGFCLYSECEPFERI